MIITKTPFRVSFFGGGTDIRGYYKKSFGCVLSTTIDKFIYVVVKKQTGVWEHKYRINWSQIEFRNSINRIKHPIIREALRYFKIDFPIEVSTFSDIPSDTGLASSSAFAVGLVSALLKITKKRSSKAEIAKIAARIEVDILKRKIGKQDHYSCAYGGLNLIKFYPNEKVVVKKVRIPKKVFKKISNNFYLFYTNKKRNASKILKNQFQPSKNQIKLLDKLKEMVFLGKSYLKNENTLSKFAELLNESWSIKKKINSNSSNQNISNFYNRSIKLGSRGGKILGAGKGGFLILYYDKNNKNLFINKMKPFKNMKFKFIKYGTKIMKFIN